ncbi:hypothetical protein AAG565_01240 [Fontimonas sp. SYSU GA230001]|uniref:hypothetical protein n=1 Tax=Fontimonas sp. SYSU GA230001 TaxID=3142450 RepID=UPI0032B3BD1E
MTKKKHHDVAEALLDAHVAYLVAQLSGDGLQALIEAELDALLVDGMRLKLKDVVSAKMIKDTARTYAADIEMGGGLPQLVADVAQAVYAHKVLDHTTPKDIVTHTRYTEFIDKLLELRSLRDGLVREIATSPIYIAFASDLLYHGIKGYLARSTELTRGIPGASSVMKLGRSVMSKASPGLEASLDEQLKKYVARSVEATAKSSADFVLKHLNDEALRDMAREIWDRSKFTPLGTLRDHIDGDDLEDLFVIGYEYWRELRKTEFYGRLIDAGIDAFFDAYGDAYLGDLLDDLGITRDLMIAEAMRYAPHVIKVLKRKKLLDGILRRQLAGFYRSGAVEQVLAGHMPQPL